MLFMAPPPEAHADAITDAWRAQNGAHAVSGALHRYAHWLRCKQGPADGYAGILNGRSRPWTDWGAWKSCSSVDILTVGVILLCVR